MASEKLEQFFNTIKDLPEMVGCGDTSVGVHTRGLFGVTPLHVAASRADTETVKMLLDAGADIDARGEENCTPLHQAIAGGHVDTARLLISRGADPKLKSSFGDAYELAAAHESERIRRLFEEGI